MSISNLFSSLPAPPSVEDKHRIRFLQWLAVALTIGVCGPMHAEIKLVKIGNPLWEPTGFARSTVNIRATNNSQGNANIREILSEMLGSNHNPYFVPGTGHDGPYETEFKATFAASGMINTDTFLSNEIYAPNVVMSNYVLVPTADAPLGASNDFALGPIIPEEVFPIRVTGELSVSGSRIGHGYSERHNSLERLVSSSVRNPENREFTGLSYSHVPVYDWVGRFQGERVVGEWEWQREFRDATGNGWDMIETFDVVPRDTDIVGDLNYNGELDMDDYNILRQNVAFAPAGEPNPSFLRLDMNADNLVDAADTSHWAGMVGTPEATSLTVGQTFHQDFDSLGPDGAAGSPLPTAWTVTDKYGTSIRNETSVAFPSISTLIRRSGQNHPFAFNVGQNEDRALAIYIPRDREESAVQLLADTDAQARAVKIDFSVEAWDRIQSATANRDGGEAAFDVTVEIDTGDGTSDWSKMLGGDFTELLNLGMVSTGAVLPIPDGDILDGNDPAHRLAFSSEIMHADIPAGSRLRFRWNTTEEAAASEGWLFGIDDVKITLASAGDANLDGQFDSGDIVHALQAGRFATDQSALWNEGDWNGDQRFDSSDLIIAFQEGGYEQAAVDAVAVVPEPSSMTLVTLGLLVGLGRTRKR